jgi:hypothetical protein
VSVPSSAETSLSGQVSRLHDFCKGIECTMGFVSWIVSTKIMASVKCLWT